MVANVNSKDRANLSILILVYLLAANLSKLHLGILEETFRIVWINHFLDYQEDKDIKMKVIDPIKLNYSTTSIT